ncbi:LuxR C-terminal-related transcriptional regulator [Streptomyces sp. CA-106110]|uniref:helix-turn-helix transcriptional regulator n=1 Tax=Streptomyces sp. CA-106110 TaxID=3240044 RepID=UPI003D8ADEFF
MTVIIERAGCVGREHELAELEQRLVATRTSGAAAVLVLGDRGIGKTALLRAFVSTTGAPTRHAQAVAWERHEAGAVLRQLLRREPPLHPSHAADRLAAGLVEQPTLIVVDDAEVADDLSVDALRSVRHRHPEIPVLIVLSATHGAPRLSDLADDALRIEGLEASAIVELAALRGRVLPPSMAAALTRHTDGNPRDALALLDELPPARWIRPDRELPAPGYVRVEVTRALADAGPAGRALAEALAVLGPGAELGHAAALGALEDPLAALDDLRSSGLIDPRPIHEPRWRTPLIATAVLETMGARDAAEAHRRAAQIVTDPVAQMRHLAAATPVPDDHLAERITVLAIQRGEDGAWAQAADLFRDASRLTSDPAPRDERLIRSVDALVAAGDCAGAGALVSTVEGMRETPLRNAALAYLAIVRGRANEAEVRLRRAWEIVNATRDPATAALIAQRHVLHSLAQCRGADLIDWADRAIELAGPDSGAGIEAAAIRGLGFAVSGRFAEAQAAYSAVASMVRHGAQAQRVQMGHGWLGVLIDDPDEARSRLEGVTDPWVLGGSTRISLWALGWLARVQFLTGEWDLAMASVARGRLLAAGSGIVLVTPLLEWTAAEIHVLRGEWESASEAARAAEAEAQGYEIMRVPTLLARAHLAEARSDYAGVRRILAPFAQAGPGSSLAEPGIWPWADTLAGALIADGRLDEADQLLAPHERRAAEESHHSAQARLAAARGRWHGARGELDQARGSFDAALAQLDGLPLRYEQARVTFVYGQTLRRAGQRRDAEVMLATARDLWDALGARTRVEAADRELRAGGVRAPQGPRTPGELTPQEETVAQMVASGLSNREVAARLFISPKTVQFHLTRIYAKYGLRSRTELAARAAEHQEPHR